MTWNNKQRCTGQGSVSALGSGGEVQGSIHFSIATTSQGAGATTPFHTDTLLAHWCPGGHGKDRGKGKESELGQKEKSQKQEEVRMQLATASVTP